MKYSPEAYNKTRKSPIFLMTAGGVLAAWAGFNLITYGNLIMDGLGLVAGLFFLYTGYSSRKAADRFPQYGDLIVTKGIRTTQRLSEMLNITPETAMRDVKTMIAQKALLNAELSDKGIITDLSVPKDYDAPSTITCPGCGATLSAHASSCLFCGRDIK